MADTTLFELVSPEKLVMSKNVSMVVVPGAEGFLEFCLGILPCSQRWPPELLTSTRVKR